MLAFCAVVSEAGNGAQVTLQRLLDCRSHQPPILAMADGTRGPAVADVPPVFSLHLLPGRKYGFSWMMPWLRFSNLNEDTE